MIQIWDFEKTLKRRHKMLGDVEVIAFIEVDGHGLMAWKVRKDDKEVTVLDSDNLIYWLNKDRVFLRECRKKAL